MSAAVARSLRHPCFNPEAHQTFARMHLPVAAACNVQCGFCDRQYACVNESRPGVTAGLMAPEEALQAVARASKVMRNLSVVGIAGPGDPLANPATLDTLRLLQRDFPQLMPCLSTNGLALPEHADALAALGVGHVTVTVNAVEPSVGARIYQYVTDAGERLTGAAAAECLLRRQEQGVRRLKVHGVTVKINTVVIPALNAGHVPAIAERVADWGADLMNSLALLPVPGTPLSRFGTPSPWQMERIRAEAGRFLPQMRHCARCRADALGLLGESGTLSGAFLAESVDRCADSCPQSC